MDHYKLPISDINKLFKDKKLKHPYGTRPFKRQNYIQKFLNVQRVPNQ